MPIKSRIKSYYDKNTGKKISDFVNGNKRVEKAWEKLLQWAPKNPKRILELGCGIGYICGRMKEKWPAAKVVGIDISSESIKKAKELFSDTDIEFLESNIYETELMGNFDLIVLMDVYEHIELCERKELHSLLNKRLSTNGSIFLSFPTPGYLEFLRINRPGEIQPVDENITIRDVEILAKDISANLLYFRKVTVWQTNDYAHAVVSRNNEFLDKDMNYTGFLILDQTEKNMDTYSVRKSILKAIEDILPQMNGNILDVGCGRKPYKPLLLANGNLSEYIGLDFASGDYAKGQSSDMIWDGKIIPLKDNSVDNVIATEVFEHIPDPEIVLKEIIRVLIPGGIFFLTIPFLWPLHDVPNDQYRYTPYSLERHLRNAGFKDLYLKPLGGWDSALAQMIGLWVRRKPMDESQRAVLAGKFFPIYKELIQSDVIPQKLAEGTMITGLSGTAKKPDKFNVATNKLKEIRHEEGISISKQNKSNTCIAIFAPYLGAISETFITQHIKKLSPGKTVVVTGEIIDDSWFDGVAKVIPYTPGFARYEQKIESEVIQFFDENKATHILCEYGCLGTELVELNQRLLHLPIYVHFHGFDASQELKKPHIINYYRWMGQNVSSIVVDTKLQKQRLVSIGIPKSKIHIIPYGVEIPSSKATPESSPCRFLSVTRLYPKKGPLYLLDAFLKAKKSAPEISLDIIGDGPLRKDIEKFIERNQLNSCVMLHGPQSNGYVKAFMQKACVYAQHSVTDPDTGDAEGLPVAILEASATGLPIISTYHEGIPDEVDHEVTGFLVDEFDTDSMAEYMIQLSHNSELRKKMGFAGREKIRREFTNEREIHRLRKLMGIGDDQKGDTQKAINETISTGPPNKLSEASIELINTQSDVCVVIPTYNRQKFIPRALNSVFSQNHPVDEIIVVDDGSTDDTYQMMQSFQAEYPIIKYFRLNKNKGAQTARNAGIRNAKSEWVCFLDSDDEWLPARTERALGKAAYEHFDVIHCNSIRQSSNGQQQIMDMNKPSHEGYIYNAILRKPLTTFPGLFVRKTCFEKINYLDESIQSWQEWDTSIRLAEYYKFGYIPEPLFIWHWHDEDTISKDLLRDAQGYFQIIEKHRDEIIKHVGYEALIEHYFAIANKFIKVKATHELSILRTKMTHCMSKIGLSIN